MALTFRNVTASPDDPVTSWPTEAVLTTLERGDLDGLRRIRNAINVDPWGRTARQVEEVLGHTRPYGVAELMEAAIAAARAEADAAERAAVASELRRLVAESGLSRADFARRLGTSRSRLSTYLSGTVVPAATLMVRARRNTKTPGAAGQTSTGRGARPATSSSTSRAPNA
ncbi:MAG: helix-turn-helix transcriptional regulator [Actinomycetota bacterium]|nr:helix-turn-helix transcriptional regulator [Actinomycetota bacterium]